MNNPNIALLVDNGYTGFYDFETISKLCSYEGHVKRVGSASSTADIASQVELLHPNLLFIARDWASESSDGKGLEVISEIEKQTNQPAIYIVSENTDVGEFVVNGVIYRPTIEDTFKIFYGHQRSPEGYVYGDETRVGMKTLSVLKQF